MHALRSVMALGVVLATAGLGSAQVLSTGTTANNGTGGVFLTLTPLNANLQVNSFSTFYGSTAGSAVSVQVWTRPGAYTGFTASSDGWTLVDTVSATSAGTTTLAAPAVLSTPVDIALGTSTSIYLHSVTAGGGLRYFGTGTTSTSSYSNADVQMFTDISRTGAVAFAGTQFTPRAFAGEIAYTIAPAPEPASLGLVGLAALGGWWGHRRRSKRLLVADAAAGVSA